MDGFFPSLLYETSFLEKKSVWPLQLEACYVITTSSQIHRHFSLLWNLLMDL